VLHASKIVLAPTLFTRVAGLAAGRHGTPVKVVGIRSAGNELLASQAFGTHKGLILLVEEAALVAKAPFCDAGLGLRIEEVALVAEAVFVALGLDGTRLLRPQLHPTSPGLLAEGAAGAEVECSSPLAHERHSPGKLESGGEGQQPDGSYIGR